MSGHKFVADFAGPLFGPPDVGNGWGLERYSGGLYRSRLAHLFSCLMGEICRV